MGSRSASIRNELQGYLVREGWKAMDDSFYGSVMADLVMKRHDDVFFVMDVRDERGDVHFASVVETASHQDAMRPSFAGTWNCVLLTTGQTTGELSDLARELHVGVLEAAANQGPKGIARSFADQLEDFDPLAAGNPDRPWALAPPFDQATPDELNRLARCTSFEEHKQSELIYESGSQPDALYILTRGTVELLQRDVPGNVSQDPWFRGSLSVFGEMAILDGQPRMVAARVTSERAEVWRMDATGFVDLVRSNPAVRKALHSVLTEITRTQAEYVHDCGFKLLQSMAAAMRSANECRVEHLRQEQLAR
jgi:CRP-like cAMP-binding protein